jgi:hypothetical protein
MYVTVSIICVTVFIFGATGFIFGVAIVISDATVFIKCVTSENPHLPPTPSQGGGERIKTKASLHYIYVSTLRLLFYDFKDMITLSLTAMPAVGRGCL